MNADAYLDRIGLSDERAAAVTPDREFLARLLSAHVQTVPFENLSIVGDPHGSFGGEGVSLSASSLFEKIVERERGGFCFELNGLFTAFLRSLGYDADRCGARVGGGEDTLADIPANHHTVVVHLDSRYLADAGSGTPQPRLPIPLDGSVVEDPTGVRWRVDESTMALSDYELWIKTPGEAWDRRYRFQTEARRLGFFEATCEYLVNQPNGTFTSAPIVQRSTPDGSLQLDEDTLERVDESGKTATTIRPDEWRDCLADSFGITL